MLGRLTALTTALLLALGAPAGSGRVIRARVIVGGCDPGVCD